MGHDTVKYSNEQPPLIENHTFYHNSVMKHPNLTNKVSLPMFSRVRNVMEALLTQNNDGDIVKYVNELLPLLKILPIYHHVVEKH